MKKNFITVLFFFSFSLLLAVSAAQAKQNTLSTYYPSSSGTYTKVHLENSTGGPDQNACFCAQSSTYPTGLNPNTNQCDTADSSATYLNAGTVFTDPNSGNTEICKHDGSVASYAGACFSRFCSGAGCAGTCPTGYTAVANTSSPFPGVSSYSCCLSTTNAQGQATVAKAGCFSIYSSGSSAPASCTSVDVNAYDMGCQSFNGACSAVRTCCFNAGPNALGVVTTAGCSGSGPINGACIGWGLCTPTSGSCGPGTQLCTASTNPSCGGNSAVGSSQGCTAACCTPNCDDGMCHAADYTGNCGQVCTANCSGVNGCLGDSDCACGPFAQNYTVAAFIANFTNNQSATYCSSTCGVISSAASVGPGCGNPGTGTSQCVIIYNNLCSPSCNNNSCVVVTGNCGQVCPPQYSYDDCGVCNGNGNEWPDSCGVPCGDNSERDNCGQCWGDGCECGQCR